MRVGFPGLAACRKRHRPLTTTRRRHGKSGAGEHAIFSIAKTLRQSLHSPDEVSAFMADRCGVPSLSDRDGLGRYLDCFRRSVCCHMAFDAEFGINGLGGSVRSAQLRSYQSSLRARRGKSHRRECHCLVNDSGQILLSERFSELWYSFGFALWKLGIAGSNDRRKVRLLSANASNEIHSSHIGHGLVGYKKFNIGFAP